MAWRWWRGVASAVAAGLLLVSAGCGGDGIDDSELVIYSGRQEALVGPLLERFEQQTGIATSVRYGNTAQLAAQLLEEGESTPADVYFSQDGGALGALGHAGRLEKLPQTALDAVPARFRADDGTWVGTSGRARVIVYDPKQVTAQDVPDSVFELTDPRWRGKVGIAPSNASFEAFVTAIRVLRGDQAARDWLAGMRANQVQTFDNNVLILNAVEDGVVQLGLINHYYFYEQVAEEGAAAVPARLKYL
ncbi:MAG: extracellular solute-binding protein, partial [Actinobacteria bacterium]|nr:extracellular solute-binding protein [Actinomycetota bacterium]